jgi:hypothetical protein
MIPQQGAHGGIVQQNRRRPGVEQRHLHSSLTPADLEPALLATLAVRTLSWPRESKPDLDPAGG